MCDWFEVQCDAPIDQSWCSELFYEAHLELMDPLWMQSVGGRHEASYVKVEDGMAQMHGPLECIGQLHACSYIYFRLRRIETTAATLLLSLESASCVI